MNADQMKGNWKQLVGKAKEKWGKLTDNDWKVVEGKRDQLVGRIQERYGLGREEAERQVADFERTHERIYPATILQPTPRLSAAIRGIDGVSVLGLAG
jgi:uncharacterized protein YjbJ (UPF0337 family)